MSSVNNALNQSSDAADAMPVDTEYNKAVLAQSDALRDHSVTLDNISEFTRLNKLMLPINIHPAFASIVGSVAEKSVEKPPTSSSDLC